MKKKYVQCFISFIDDGRSKETQQFFHFSPVWRKMHTHSHTCAHPVSSSVAAAFRHKDVQMDKHPLLKKAELHRSFSGFQAAASC